MPDAICSTLPALPACARVMRCLCAAHARGMAASLPCNTSESPTIVRIIAVRDTRDVIEVGERFVPIPGTGDQRECDRCGRTHEVHVDVELDNGATAVIGAGCARGESMAVVAAIKSAVSAAKTRARLAAELAAARTTRDAARSAWALIGAMPLPAVEFLGMRDDAKILGMGDARAWARPSADMAERHQCLISGWRNNRYAEQGFKASVWSLDARCDELERRLEAADRKLAKLVEGSR